MECENCVFPSDKNDLPTIEAAVLKSSLVILISNPQIVEAANNINVYKLTSVIIKCVR